MAKFSEEKIKQIWDNSQKVENEDPNNFRKDPCRAWIKWDEYGKDSKYGWSIDHILPESLGGTDRNENLRAMHFKNNQSKANNFPNYIRTVTSEGNVNVSINDSFEVNKTTIESLRKCYPNNEFLKNLK